MPLPPLNPGSSGLGSLAHSARSKKLNQARWILIVVGILGICWMAVSFAFLRTVVQDAIRKEEQKAAARGLRFDPQEKQQIEDRAVRIGRWVLVSFMAVYAVILGLGVLVKLIPVVATVTSLVLVLGHQCDFWGA